MLFLQERVFRWHKRWHPAIVSLQRVLGPLWSQQLLHVVPELTEKLMPASRKCSVTVFRMWMCSHPCASKEKLQGPWPQPNKDCVGREACVAGLPMKPYTFPNGSGIHACQESHWASWGSQDSRNIQQEGWGGLRLHIRAKG